MAYPNENVLLCSISDIKSWGILDENANEKLLLSALKYEQDEIIHNVIGSKLYDRLISLIASGDINKSELSVYKELLEGYIFFILAWRIRGEWAFICAEKSRNQGTGVSDGNYFRNNSITDIYKVKDHFNNKADKYIIELEKWLCHNWKLIPELREFTHWWEKRPTKGNRSSLIYFPKKGCCGGCS